MTQKLEPHFLAAILASQAACSILDLMPATDLVEELRNLIYIQEELFNHMLDGKHYGTDNLTDFMDYAQHIKEDMMILKHNQEWGRE